MLVIRKVVELVDRWFEENGFQMSTTKTKILRNFAGRGGSTRFEHPKEYQGAESCGEGSAK
jgi:hypothetical protein